MLDWPPWIFEKIFLEKNIEPRAIFLGCLLPKMSYAAVFRVKLLNLPMKVKAKEFTGQDLGLTPFGQRQIEENRLNLNRSTQRGVSTAYNTCFN